MYSQTGKFATVAASQTDQVLGLTGGAAGDYLAAIHVVPTTTAPGAISIKDNGGSAITLWAGGTVGADLKPFLIELQIRSVTGPWKITTGANVSAIAVGAFS